MTPCYSRCYNNSYNNNTDMKKTLLLALVLAVPAMAGVSAPLAVAPNPDNAPVPQVAPTVSPWSVEIGGVYRWACDDIHSEYKDVDVWGGELTAIYKINDNHSVNVRFGYNVGDISDSSYTESVRGQQYIYEKEKIDVESFYIMPGYRYTDSITDNISWYVGANVGISNMKADYEYAYVVNNDTIGDPIDLSGDDWGFAASAELGVQYHITDCVYLFGAYQYWMSTARPSDHGVKAKKQSYHSVTAGVGINF